MARNRSRNNKDQREQQLYLIYILFFMVLITSLLMFVFRTQHPEELEIPDPIKMREIATLNIIKKIHKEIKYNAESGKVKYNMYDLDMGGFSVDELLEIMEDLQSDGFVIEKKPSNDGFYIRIKW